MDDAAIAEADPFDYAALSADNRRWARAAAPKIRSRLARATEHLLEAARLLRLARKRLGRLFVGFAEAVVGVSRRTAHRLVQVAEAFAGVPAAVFRNMTRTAVYQLALPGVPQAVREYAVEVAGDGGRVTGRDVYEIVLSFRDPKIPTRAEVAAVFANRAPDPKDPPPEGDANAADNWRLLVELLEAGETVHLSPVADQDYPPTYHGMAWGAGGRRGFGGATPEAVLLLLAGVDRVKRCRSCKGTKRVDCFSKLAKSRDGRNDYCKPCERRRVSDYERSRRTSAAVLTAHAPGGRSHDRSP